MDIVGPDVRSRMMANIGGKNTKPERILRSMLHRAGYRFRLHVRNLPGKPDIVLSKYRTVIEVRGCFWHRHENCRFATMPKTREAFWQKKFTDTVARDERNEAALKGMGWTVIIVWECELKDSPEAVLQKIATELSKKGP